MLGAIGRGLITAGVVVLLFVVFQLWGTNIQEARAQDGLRDDFDDTFALAQSQLALFADSGDTDPPAVIDAGGTDGTPDLPAPTSTLPGGFDPTVLQYFFPEGGDATARIEIPSIGVDKIVVNGVQVADLRKGPGHYPDTASVGTAGNTAIAGHRTTYGAPFNRIDELRPGDEIHVTGVLGRFTYRVMAPADAYPEQLDTVDSSGDGHIIVRPGATWVLGDFLDNRVTLTACHPKLSSRQRIIVAAELVDEPAALPDFAPALVAEFVGGDATPTLPGEEVDDGGDEAGADPASGPRTVPASDLDEGLDGERDAIPAAVIWFVVATAIWIGFGYLARHLFAEKLRRVAVRSVGLLPAGYCLWFAFEALDRALPAG
ncbi:MAG: sortase [Acidimicrobiales bacterium]|nr:sortase [Acidimicrobiales bacterium]